MGNSAPLGPPMAPRLRSWGQINWFHSGFRPLWGRAFLQAGTVRIRTAHGPKAVPFHTLRQTGASPIGEANRDGSYHRRILGT